MFHVKHFGKVAGKNLTSQKQQWLRIMSNRAKKLSFWSSGAASLNARRATTRGLTKYRGFLNKSSENNFVACPEAKSVPTFGLTQ
jgi:hypothetical protein